MAMRRPDQGHGREWPPEPLPAWLMPGDSGAIPVRIAFTLRPGGVSRGPYGAADEAGEGEGSANATAKTAAGGFNLGDHVDDDPRAVAANRSALVAAIGRPVRWLRQVHGACVADADRAAPGSISTRVDDPVDTADAQVCVRADRALAILVADCLPVLLADRQGRVVGAAHAGWRGLAGGVIEATAAAMRSRQPDADLVAWFGPCIGRDAFEVGDDVRAAFIAHDAGAADAFRAGRQPGKWWADLPALARARLRAAGIALAPGGAAQPDCTVSDPRRYWSFRRDRRCGRMAALIWRLP